MMGKENSPDCSNSQDWKRMMVLRNITLSLFYHPFADYARQKYTKGDTTCTFTN